MADRVCLIATVRSPINELMEFTRCHLEAGIDEISLFFDDPNDTAANSFAGFPEVLSVVCDAS
jgi:hypothetical protein